MTGPITGKLFSFSNNGMRSNNPRTANRKLFAAKQAIAVRFREEGFPVRSKFESVEELRDYFSGDKIICLQCGKPYRALACHITRAHSMTADEYKEYYGIPWRYGLTCEGTKERSSRAGKAAYEEGRGGFNKMSVEEQDQARAKAHKTKHRPPPKAMINRAIEIALSVHGRDRQFKASEYEAILEKMRADDLNIGEAIEALPNGPKDSHFRLYARRNPEFAAKLGIVKQGLSFEAQKRATMLGDAFKSEVQKRRSDGEYVKDIARSLGVSPTTVIMHSEGVQRPPSTRCPNGHPRQGERCRICDTEARRRRRGELPRAESAKTKVPSSCDDCGQPIFITRLRGQHRVKLCDGCRHARQRHSYRRYKERLKAKTVS